MVYETSYESGRKPFRPDTTRGYWAQPSDFIIVCMGLAFKLDFFSVSWIFFDEMGFLALVPYLFCLALYVVPLMVIQSFIGQFSSSGFISAFRVSPMFKGIGYVSLALNLSILTYYSLFAAVPLLYLFNSFRPTLPWSCEGFSEWAHTIEEKAHICNLTEKVITDESELYENATFNDLFLNYQVPSVLFFRKHFDALNFYSSQDDFSLSWALLFCSLLTWCIVAVVFYYFFETAKLGRIIRYAIFTALTLLLICLTRFIFLPGAWEGFKEYFKPQTRDLERGFASVSFFVVSAFGAGWGTIISLASFNRFKTNVMKFSWFICLGQVGIILAFGMATNLLEKHYSTITDNNYMAMVEHHWILYLSSGSALASMELPNMWCILFYTMMTLSALIVMVIQILSILVSIFDEFEELRSRKKQVAFTLFGFLSLYSFYFCSNDGISYFTALSIDAVFTQTALNLLLILVVLWIYGRERFQRDIEFMLSQRFATWKVFMLRFITPIYLIIILVVLFIIAFYEHFYSSTVVLILGILFIMIPWLCVPAYGVLSMFQTSGSFCIRFRRCCRPTDWYPVEADERQRYEEAMGNMDTTHQLHEVREEVL